MTLMDGVRASPSTAVAGGGGIAPSRKDVIEAESADPNGRSAGKMMLEALEVEPAKKAGTISSWLGMT